MSTNNLYAGTTFSLDVDYSTEYPSSTYDAVYILINSSYKYQVTSTNNSDLTWTFTATPAVTALWTPGNYKYQIYAYTETAGVVTARYLVEFGYIDILPDLTSESTYDTRTHAKKCLDAIEAVLENRATKDQQMYTIAGRQLMRMNIADLIKLRSYYQAEYQRECDSAAGTNSFKIQTRFV